MISKSFHMRDFCFCDFLPFLTGLISSDQTTSTSSRGSRQSFWAFSFTRDVILSQIQKQITVYMKPCCLSSTKSYPVRRPPLSRSWLKCVWYLSVGTGPCAQPLPTLRSWSPGSPGVSYRGKRKKGREQKATDKDTESVNRGFTLWGNYSLFSHHFWSVFPTKILQTQPTPH